MRQKPVTAIFLVILLFSTIPFAEAAEKKRYILKTTYIFENKAKETYLFTEDDATIVLFVNDDWQTVTTRNSSHQIARYYEDEDGNLLAVMDLPTELPSGTSLFFSIEYVIDSEEMPRPEISAEEAGPLSDIPPRLKEVYCIETETFRRNEEIKSLAQMITAGEATVLGSVTKLIEWMLNNVTYGNFELPRYPEETLRDMRGDCDDQAILLISMLRSLGIPAFLQIGVVFSDNIDSERVSWDGHLTIKQEGVGWHGWTMIYIPPWGWLPIDLTLSGAKYPMEVIFNTPAYASFVVSAYNVSRQAYVGGSRESRERITNSGVYIKVADIAIEESTGLGWVKLVYVFTGLLAGGAFVAYIIVFKRRRQILEYGY